jgi:hypothetical protein
MTVLTTHDHSGEMLTVAEVAGDGDTRGRAGASEPSGGQLAGADAPADASARWVGIGRP